MHIYTMDNKTIGKKLRELREECSLTPEEVEECADIPALRIRMIEDGCTHRDIGETLTDYSRVIMRLMRCYDERLGRNIEL